MRPDLDGRVFRSVSNTGNGEVGEQTVFRYRQSGDLVSADYAGGSIVAGHLIAIMDADGNLDMRYHHVNAAATLMVGTCRSRLEVLADGRLRYHESWRWLSGDGSEGESVIEERRA